MTGQIAPKNLFDIRPDLRALAEHAAHGSVQQGIPPTVAAGIGRRLGFLADAVDQVEWAALSKGYHPRRH